VTATASPHPTCLYVVLSVALLLLCCYWVVTTLLGININLKVKLYNQKICITHMVRSQLQGPAEKPDDF